MSYEVIRYVPELRDQVLALQVHLWSDDLTLNDRYMRWKYEHNPYFPEPLLYLVVTEGQVVGMRGMIGARWEMGDPLRSFSAPVGGDTVIAPAHRKRDLFQMIDMAAEQDLLRHGYDYAFNFSANPGTYILSRRTGWELAGAHRTLIRPKAPAPAGAAERLRALGSRLTLRTEPRPADMAALVRRLGSDGRIRHQRDEVYFNWRFGNPLNAYGFIFCDESQLEGYLAVRMDRDRRPTRFHILDWTASSDGMLEDLLVAAQSAFGGAQLAIWSATLSPHQLAALNRAGFKAVDDTRGIDGFLPGILVRRYATGNSPDAWQAAGCLPNDLAHWDLRMIYSDGY